LLVEVVETEKTLNLGKDFERGPVVIEARC
jgi:hypothetical protein